MHGAHELKAVRGFAEARGNFAVCRIGNFVERLAAFDCDVVCRQNLGFAIANVLTNENSIDARRGINPVWAAVVLLGEMNFKVAVAIGFERSFVEIAELARSAIRAARATDGEAQVSNSADVASDHIVPFVGERNVVVFCIGVVAADLSDLRVHARKVRGFRVSVAGYVARHGQDTKKGSHPLVGFSFGFRIFEHDFFHLLNRPLQMFEGFHALEFTIRVRVFRRCALGFARCSRTHACATQKTAQKHRPEHLSLRSTTEH